MILKKEFYFIRHGQTEHNIAAFKVDHDDISLNATGLRQAQAIEPIISSLPIKSICFSPLKRAKETKDIISVNIHAPHYEIPELGECSRLIWDDMTKLGTNAIDAPLPHVREFLKRTLSGINQALSLDGPVLVVAHGGIHWALSCLTQVKDHTWIIDNCVPVHFSLGPDGGWQARKLI